MTQFGDQRLPVRFWEKCSQDANGCWSWTASRSRYGRVGWGGKNRSAHRVAYEALVGAVGARLELDHLCRNRYCVNPVHLEPVTHHENLMRGNAPAARQSRQTHCKRGHELTPENIVLRKRGNGRTYRSCTLCRQHGRMRRNKLTAEKAREIRRRVDQGEVQARLAEEFGISISNVSAIVNGKAWQHAFAKEG